MFQSLISSKVRGSYILEIVIPFDVSIKVGKLGWVYFRRGVYYYIGSAFGKHYYISSRIRRYLGQIRKKRWHIDYIVSRFPPSRIFIFENVREEELYTVAMHVLIPAVKGFGCTDKKSLTHLFIKTQ